jgi:DNA-binding GntR family transcriptional regulator
LKQFQHKTLRESVADYIRKMILRHELMPGSRIVEQELSDTLGISRGPVREALRQLEQEGLVIYKRNIGCSVREVNLSEIIEALLLRGSYELTALKACNGIIDAECLKKMEEALEGMLTADGSDFVETSQYDTIFHRCLVEAAHMPYLLKAYTDLDFFTFFNYSTEVREVKTVVNRQYEVHKKIYDIYKAGNFEESKKILIYHYRAYLDRKVKDSNMTMDDFPFSFDILS